MVGNRAADDLGGRVLRFTNGERNRPANRREAGQQRPQFLEGIRLKLRKT